MDQFRPRPSLRVLVRLPTESGDGSADHAPRDRISRYANALFKALGLAPHIQLDFAPASGSAAEVLIDNEPLAPEGSQTPDADALEQAVCLSLYRGRELLVTDAIVRDLWQSWFAERGLTDDSTPVYEMYREAARRGLGLERLRGPLADCDPGDQGRADQIMEEVAKEAAPAKVTIHLSAADYARCFDADGAALPLAEDGDTFPRSLELMADVLFGELGLIYACGTPLADADLESPWFRLSWNDIPLPRIKGLDADQLLVNETVETLSSLGLPASPARAPSNGAELATVRGRPEELRKQCEDAGLSVWGPKGYLLLWASRELRRNAGAFMNRGVFDLLATQLATYCPDLADTASARFGDTTLTRVLVRLLDAGVSVRDLRRILEALLASGGNVSVPSNEYIVFAPHGALPFWTGDALTTESATADELTDNVRTALRRWLTYRHSRDGNTLAVWLLDPTGIERRLRDPRPLDLEERKSLLAAVSKEVGSLPPTAQGPIILTDIAVGRRLRRFLGPRLPGITVLAYQELSPDANIEPIGRLAIA